MKIAIENEKQTFQVKSQAELVGGGEHAMKIPIFPFKAMLTTM